MYTHTHTHTHTRVYIITEFFFIRCYKVEHGCQGDDWPYRCPLSTEVLDNAVSPTGAYATPGHPHLPSRSPSPPFPFTLTSLPVHPHLPSRSPSPPSSITLTSLPDHPHLPSRSPLPPLTITLTPLTISLTSTHDRPYLHSQSPPPPLLVHTCGTQLASAIICLC